MTLTLTLQDVACLENDEATSLTLERHGAVIGRSPHADWSLPDPSRTISSRHLEVSYRDGYYVLDDLSTNGTFLNGASEPLKGPHRIADGDRIAVGDYTITVGSGADPTASAPPADVQTGRERATDSEDGWAAAPGKVAGRPADRAATRDSFGSCEGPWDEPMPVTRSSEWSSELRRAGPEQAKDVWGDLSERSIADWERDGASTTPAFQSFAAPPDAAPLATEPLKDASSARRSDGHGPGWQSFVVASGLPVERLERSPADALAAAGMIMRQLTEGLIRMLDARARAKSQLAVQATGLELEGNNPLKFVRSAERALLQLLDEPQPGFMPASRAVDDAFQDLQAHQLATFAAMRGALTGTLSRFSPAAIRQRLAAPEMTGSWLSVFRRARLWDAYEKGYEGVVRGADEAFMDLFAQEFRLHYDRHMAELKECAGNVPRQP